MLFNLPPETINRQQWSPPGGQKKDKALSSGGLRASDIGLINKRWKEYTAGKWRVHQFDIFYAWKDLCLKFRWGRLEAKPSPPRWVPKFCMIVFRTFDMYLLKAIMEQNAIQVEEKKLVLPPVDKDCISDDIAFAKDVKSIHSKKSSWTLQDAWNDPRHLCIVLEMQKVEQFKEVLNRDLNLLLTVRQGTEGLPNKRSGHGSSTSKEKRLKLRLRLQFGFNTMNKLFSEVSDFPVNALSHASIRTLPKVMQANNLT